MLPLARAASLVTSHIEHVYAQQHTTDDSLENLCLACPRCNLQKGPNLTTIDAEFGKIVPLFHPRQQNWQEHFEVQEYHIVGRTTTG
ncbi:MAG: hypothetical protein CMJ78_21380 [Planctomycetaceae bacterium]|nr:hypothetical protein [Planctomycetaceae bacterium]